MRLKQRHCIWRSFTDCPSIDILYYPEECDDKGELIKGWPLRLLRRATLWFMYVMSEINDPSKEVKVRFMKKSGQYILLSKKLEKWFPKSAMMLHKIPSIDHPYHPLLHRCSIKYHPLTIPCIIPLIPSILKVYVKK